MIAEVNQAIPGAPTPLNRGTWESSGIVDASAVFGPGAFLVDVQAHGWERRSPVATTPPRGFSQARERAAAAVYERPARRPS